MADEQPKPEKPIDERLEALVKSLTARLKGEKVANKTKVIYRIEVQDKYTEFDSPTEFSFALRELVNGHHNETFKAPIKPEDLRITVRTAPADPESPKWKPIE